MYCDYNALADYATVLSKDFRNISQAMDLLEEKISTLTVSVWDAKTRDVFMDKFREVQNNFINVNNKFNNVRLYVDNVINNYRSFDE